MPPDRYDQEQSFHLALAAHPALAAHGGELYLRLLPAARAEVLHRFALGLLREGVFEVESTRRAGASTSFRGRIGACELSFEVFGRGPFLRYPRLEACVLHRGGDDVRVEHPVELLGLIASDLDEAFGVEGIARLRHELDNSVANLALGMAAGRAQQQRLLERGVVTLGDWIAQFGTNDELRRALEGEIRTGHRLHACSKTRVGMTPDEVVRYAPEITSAPVALRWVAVHRRALLRSGDAEALLRELWPETLAACDAELRSRVHAPGDYALLPVHPWQWDHRLDALHAQLDPSDLVRLGAESPAHPQLALRTVEPVLEGRIAPFHLKLPIAVQTTSAERTVSARPSGTDRSSRAP